MSQHYSVQTCGRVKGGQELVGGLLGLLPEEGVAGEGEEGEEPAEVANVGLEDGDVPCNIVNSSTRLRANHFLFGSVQPKWTVTTGAEFNRN